MAMLWTKAELAQITGGLWEGDLPEERATDRIAFSNVLVRPGAFVIPYVQTYLYGVNPAKIARFHLSASSYFDRGITSKWP